MMAPSESALLRQLRWSQEEIDILVRMTNDQLELEDKDTSMTITWNKHWKKVSSKLKERGYNRSHTACRGIWTRGVEAQRAHRDAAGPDWDDSEHEVLVNMTKKQLDLEKADPTTVMTWAKHWKRVSLQLEESGYDRSPDNCSAYWQLVESGAEIASEMEEDDPDDDEQTPEADGMIDNDEDHQQPGLTATSPQMSSKTSSWSLEEYKNLFRLVKERCEIDERKLSGFQFWTEVADSHRQHGFDRTLEACRSFWNRRGRERSGYDERPKFAIKPSQSDINSSPDKNPKALSNTEPSVNSSAKPDSNGSKKPSSTSSLRPVVDEAEDSIVVSLGPAVSALRKFQQENTPVTLSYSKSTGPVVIIPKSSERENVNTEKRRGKSPKSSTSAQPAEHSETSSSIRKRFTTFRLSPEQRAVLTAEASATGGNVSPARRAELAQDLDVEEKTVKNWFTTYNTKARRSQGSFAPGAPSTSTLNSFDNDSHPTESQSASQSTTPITATPPPAYRNFASVSNPQTSSKRSHPEESTPEYGHPSKRAHLEPEVETSGPANGFSPVNSNSNHQHLASQPTLPPNLPKSDRKVEISEARPDQIHVAPVNQLSLPPVVPSNTPSPLDKSHSTTVENRTEAQTKHPTQSTASVHSYLQPQKSLQNPSTQSKPHSDVTSYTTKVMYSNASESPHIPYEASIQTEKSHSTNNKHASAVTGFIPMNTSASIANREPLWAGSRAVLDDGGRMPSSLPRENGSVRQPDHVRTPIATFAVSNQNDYATIPAKTQASSPNQEWARQFEARKHSRETTNTENPKPASTPLSPMNPPTTAVTPAADQQQPRTARSTPTQVTSQPLKHSPAAPATPSILQHQAHTPLPSTPIPQNTSATSPTPPIDEDPKVMATKHVAHFLVEIQSLKATNTTRTSNLSRLTQQLSTFGTRHAEMEAAKKAEIARVMQEIEERYGRGSASLREQEENMVRERDTEAERLRKIAHEIGHKEKGLKMWQGVVEYYGNGDGETS